MHFRSVFSYELSQKNQKVNINRYRSCISIRSGPRFLIRISLEKVGHLDFVPLDIVT